MKKYMQLIRWPNLLLIALLQYLVRYGILFPVYRNAGIGFQLNHIEFILLVLSTVFIAAAGYIINDYFDVPMDKVNKPDKVLIGKHISPNEASNLHIVFSVLGIALAAFVAYQINSLKLALIQFVSVTVLWFYSSQYKRKVLNGNIAISLLAALSLAVVWIYAFFKLKEDADAFLLFVKYYGFVNRLILAYAFFSFILTFIRELLKDAEDVEGDRKAACSTFAVKYGLQYSNKLASGIAFLALLSLIYFEFWLISQSKLYTALFLIAFVDIPLIVGIVKTITAKQKKDYAFLSRLYKLIIFAGTLSMILLIL